MAKDRKPRVHAKCKHLAKALDGFIKHIGFMKGYFPKVDPIHVPPETALGAEYNIDGTVPSLQWMVQDVEETVLDLRQFVTNLEALADPESGVDI